MLYDVIRTEEKMLVKAAEKKNINLKMICSKNIYFDLHKDYLEEYGDIVLQRCVSYFRSIHITSLLESKGIKMVNGLHAAFMAGNKMNCTLELIKAGVPVPKTYMAFTPETALKALQELGYPAVLKPTIGSWGRLIAILKDAESAESIIEDREYMFPIYQQYYLQEKVNRPPRDIRAFVIGDKVVAAIYRIAPEGFWKTNTATGGKAENCPLTPILEEICLKAAAAIGEGLFGIDLMESPNGLVVHEVNNTIEFRNSVPVTGIDIPGLMLDYLVALKRC